MTDKEKQIEELSQALISLLDRETVDKFIEDEHGNLKEIKTYSLYSVAEELYNAGYREIIPNVDFVVRAGELSSIQMKVRKETAREILQAWYNENKAKSEEQERQERILQFQQRTLIDFG